MGYYLGLHVERDEVKGWLRLHQHKYLAAMGEKYGLEEGRSVKTPFPSGFQLQQKGVEEVSTKISAPARRGHLYLSCFTDATWASDISDATSHGGYICCVGGSQVSWKSKKQGEIAHSSTESEYMALFHGVKEVVWMRRLLEELGQEQE
ncbi:unnamed protein product, partial [Closterium sp. NIES-53]